MVIWFPGRDGQNRVIPWNSSSKVFRICELLEAFDDFSGDDYAALVLDVPWYTTELQILLHFTYVLQYVVSRNGLMGILGDYCDQLM